MNSLVSQCYPHSRSVAQFVGRTLSMKVVGGAFEVTDFNLCKYLVREQ